jgi:hypothetical protein
MALLGKRLDGSVDDYRSVAAHLKVSDNVHRTFRVKEEVSR